MTQSTDNLARRWQALFEGNFAPQDIVSVLDESPTEAIQWLNRALFDPLALMMGFVELWDADINAGTVEALCGVPPETLRTDLLHVVHTLYTQARQLTDDYWTGHLAALSLAASGDAPGGTSDAQAGPESGPELTIAPEEAAALPPFDPANALDVLATWESLRPACEAVLALARPVHQCFAAHAGDTDVMGLLQALAMLIRGGQRVNRTLDVAAAYVAGWRG